MTVAELKQLATKYAKQFGVPPKLFLAQLQQESGFRPDAVSHAGAQGVAQFMPGTAKAVGVDLYDNDPTDDLRGAAKHMATLKKNLGSWELALAGYNAGGGAVQKYGGIPPYAETQNYVRKIMAQAGDTSAPVAAPPSPQAVEPHRVDQQQDVGSRLAMLSALRRDSKADPMAFIQTLRQARSRPSPELPGPVPGGHDPHAGHDHGTPQVAAPDLSGDGYEWAEKLAKQFGLTVTSTYRSPEKNKQVGGSPTSAHMTHGAAADFGGPAVNMEKLHRYVMSTKKFRESFYDPVGEYWDEGRRIQGAIGGHSDHVHITR